MLSPESLGSDPLPTPAVIEFDRDVDTAHMEEALSLLSALQTAQTELDGLETRFNQMDVSEQANVDVIATMAQAQMNVKELQDKIAALGVSTQELAAQYGENPSPDDIPNLEDLGKEYRV